MTTLSVSGCTLSSVAGSHQGTSPVSKSVPTSCRAVETRCGSRSTPCRSRSVSGVIWSQRSMMAAARGSVARASAFSASVIVITRRRQDLVDLGGVEQRTGALLGDLRVVVEDDRRAQHHVVRSAGAHQHREAAVAACSAPPAPAAASGGLEQRDEPGRRRPPAARGCRSATTGSRRPCRAPRRDGCSSPPPTAG